MDKIIFQNVQEDVDSQRFKFTWTLITEKEIVNSSLFTGIQQ